LDVAVWSPNCDSPQGRRNLIASNLSLREPGKSVQGTVLQFVALVTLQRVIKHVVGVQLGF
jgi:hypothetical protein